MDIISRLPGCSGQAADAASAYTQVKMEDAPSLLKIPLSECVQICGYVYQNTNGSSYGHPLAGPPWERQFEKVMLEHGWEKVPNSECLFVDREKGYSCLCLWTI